MAPREFDREERGEVRGQMLEAGHDLIRQCGITHMLVKEVTAAIGLGKSTFYNFLPNKEHFVYEMMGYLRTQLMDYFQQLLSEREKLPVPQTKGFLKKIISSGRSIYQYLTAEDEEKLRATLSPECFFDAQHESQVMMRPFRRMEGVRIDLDEYLVANLLKITALAQTSQAQLRADALERTLQPMYELLLSCIFMEEG